jgi:hypothetical protein
MRGGALVRYREEADVTARQQPVHHTCCQHGKQTSIVGSVSIYCVPNTNCFFPLHSALSILRRGQGGRSVAVHRKGVRRIFWRPCAPCQHLQSSSAGDTTARQWHEMHPCYIRVRSDTYCISRWLPRPRVCGLCRRIRSRRLHVHKITVVRAVS